LLGGEKKTNIAGAVGPKQNHKNQWGGGGGGGGGNPVSIFGTLRGVGTWEGGGANWRHNRPGVSGGGGRWGG